MLSDTHPDAEKVQIELLRGMTPAERLGTALRLTAALVNMSRQTIASLNPDLNPQELNIKCVELFYGKDLAERLCSYLQNMEQQNVVV